MDGERLKYVEEWDKIQLSGFAVSVDDSFSVLSSWHPSSWKMQSCCLLLLKVFAELKVSGARLEKRKAVNTNNPTMIRLMD